MAQRSPAYGTPNLDMLKTWVNRPPSEDGPFWALNLMKYRPVADYGDEAGATISGREADDRYAPLGPLKAVGAMVALWVDVIGQFGAEPTWDRVGIVRYPSRVSFIEMQQRADFQRQHVHKEAGMDFTIVMSCLPDAARPPTPTPDGILVLRVARLPDGRDLAEPGGATRVATFDVEGVIIGDERTWSRVAFDVVPDAETVDSLRAERGDAEEMFAMTLGAPVIEELEASIRTAADSR
jgi:hypothetical protein